MFNVGADQPVLAATSWRAQVARGDGRGAGVEHLEPRHEVAHAHSSHEKVARVFGDACADVARRTARADGGVGARARRAAAPRSTPSRSRRTFRRHGGDGDAGYHDVAPAGGSGAAVVWKVVADHLSPWVPPDAHVLEIGAGYCRLDQRRRRRPARGRRHLAARSPTMPRPASKRASWTRRASCRRSARRQFDVVLASNVLEHFEPEIARRRRRSCARAAEARRTTPRSSSRTSGTPTALFRRLHAPRGVHRRVAAEPAARARLRDRARAAAIPAVLDARHAAAPIRPWTGSRVPPFARSSRWRDRCWWSRPERAD